MAPPQILASSAKLYTESIDNAVIIMLSQPFAPLSTLVCTVARESDEPSGKVYVLPSQILALTLAVDPKITVRAVTIALSQPLAPVKLLV